MIPACLIVAQRLGKCELMRIKVNPKSSLATFVADTSIVIALPSYFVENSVKFAPIRHIDKLFVGILIKLVELLLWAMSVLYHLRSSVRDREISSC